jgi:hypothetical protein
MAVRASHFSARDQKEIRMRRSWKIQTDAPMRKSRLLHSLFSARRPDVRLSSHQRGRFEVLEERRLLSVVTDMPDQAPAPEAGFIYYDYIDENGELNGGRIDANLEDANHVAIESDVSAPPWNSVTIIDNGPTANRVDLVFVGDGYTSSELGTYAAHLDNILPTFFSEAPLDAYSSFFNVHRVDVISNESGVDHDPTYGIYRDTALDMGFWCNNIERLLCVSVYKAMTAASAAPDVDQLMAIGNSTKYGGAGYTSSNLATFSGGNSSGIDVALHEFGHSFADLADEYDYGGPTTYTGPEPVDVNISTYDAATMAGMNAKWSLWLDEPNVDTFEGANYSQYGIYRPTLNSKMRALNQPFGQVNVEQFVLSAYKTVDPIDDATVPGTYPGTAQFFVTPVVPTTHSLDVQWSLDGTPIPGATDTTFDASTLGVEIGSYTLSVEVVDNTDLVRDEILRDFLMTEERSWTLDVTAAFDFGDAPVGYPTLFANDGARHSATGPTLGTIRDTEVDGQPTSNADGDNLNGTLNDEDGLNWMNIAGPGRKDVTISVEASAASYLNAWIDFDANGVWDSSEQIAVDTPLVAGENLLLFDMPLSAVPGMTYARLRLTSYDTGGTLLPSGPANDGEIEDHSVFIAKSIHLEGTINDDVVHVYPGSPGSESHRVSINGVFANYDASVYEAVFIDGLEGEDSLSVHGKTLNETTTFYTTSVNVDGASVYDVFGSDFENIYVYSGGGQDTATSVGTQGNEEFYVNEGYSYIRNDSRSFLNYVKGYNAITFDVTQGIAGGFDRAYIYDSENDDVLVAGESQATIDYSATASPGIDVTAIGFAQVDLYGENGGADTATLTGSAGDDFFSARQEYGYLNGNGGAFLNYVEGFESVTVDVTGEGGFDTATILDAVTDDLLIAGESEVSIDYAVTGTPDLNHIAKGFRTVNAYALFGGTDAAIMTGSDSNDRFTSKRSYSTMKRNDGAFFNYASGFDNVTADVSGGSGADLAFIYDDVTDDRFEATPLQATLDYDATPGTPSIDTTAIGFDGVYAYADYGGNDTAILTGSAGLDRFTALATYSHLKANDDSYFNYARGFDAVTANAVGTGDLAFMYGSDGDDVLNADANFATFTLNPALGGQVVNTAAAFEQVYGYATEGGTDKAYLNGTTASDAFTGNADWGYLRSKGTSDYFNYVRYFDEVFADPGDSDVDNDDLDDLGVGYALDTTPGNGNVW